MILHRVSRSLRTKLLLVILGTTFTALFVMAAAMVAYEARTFQRSWTDDLLTQAKIVARTSAPAISFNDPAAARGNLLLLRDRPQILSAAIYTARGTRFATYANSPENEARLPETAGKPGTEVDGNRLIAVHPVEENGETLGMVYLAASYPLVERVQDYVMILFAVLAVSLLLAALMAFQLQRAITKPILSVTEVARQVIQHRDFTLRARRYTDDEIGVLVDAFNGMLDEVNRRALALETSNRTLAEEMTVRHEVEAALVAADKRKDEFLATLAHELRNPLAPISSGLDLLRLAADNPKSCADAREIMERQLSKMVRLIDDLLDVSRITTGKMTVKRQRCELQSVMRDAVELVKSFIDNCGHTLEVEYPDSPIFLQCDSTRLAQVFSNLLNNAAKYTARGGTIRFGARVEDGHIVARVSDTGIGIAEDMLDRVFDMFTQVDYSLERKHAGLGVGLTLARRLVELHGGTIEARSEGFNRGSEFVVRLPVVESAAPAAPSLPPSNARASVGIQSRRILLADDNTDFVTTMSALLRSLGHEVHVAHDGAEALKAARWFHPEFAFIDIGMPKMNGYDVARELRIAPATRRTVLVAVTGWGQARDQSRAFEAGFDRHFVKPVTLAQVQRVIEEAQPVT
jgi:signal transduction histidine kinase/ActR/RegA family two-component response regulator